MSYPASEQFRTALRSSGRIVSKVDVLRNGVVIERAIPLKRGTGPQVSVDSSLGVRRTLTITVADRSMWDLLSPVGTELRAWRGVRYIDGQDEFAPLGVFSIGDQSLGYGSDSTLTVSAPDRWAVVKRSRFTSPRQWNPSWSSVADAIQALVLEPWTQRAALDPTVRVPGFNNDLGPGGPAQRATIWQRDRDTAITDLATAVGAEIYFDYNGDVRLRPKPKLSLTPVWDADASQTGVLKSASRSRSNEKAYNTVVATGVSADGSATSVRGVAQVTDPGHPLWIGGAFGTVPYFYSSPALTTNTAAVEAAQSLLLTVAGLGAQVQAVCVPNPALEEGDTVRVWFPDKAQELHLLENFTVPLLPDGEQSLTFRSTRPDGDVPAEGV